MPPGYLTAQRRGQRLVSLCAGAMVLVLCLAQAGSTQSPRRAFWLSLMVPGWGQHISGQVTSARVFAATEVALWGAVLGSRYVEDIRRDNYLTYAAEHAQAQASGKSGEYLDDLGFYQSRHQHNRVAVIDGGEDAYLYPETASYFWEWDEDASRQRYRDLRNSSTSAGRQALYASGLVVVNHLISAIHAARTAGRSRTPESSTALSDRAVHSRSQVEARPSSVQLGLAVLPGGSGVGLFARRRF